MPVKVICVTAKGGCAEWNAQHHVRASYAVTTVGDTPPDELLHVGGIEILRRNV